MPNNEMNDEKPDAESKLIDIFEKIADETFGKAPPGTIYPQHVRFASYYEMFVKGVRVGKKLSDKNS